MDDHVWSLQSWDQDGATVVKLFCGECQSFIGGSTNKHNKNMVSNLFSNFRKSHLINAWHVRNYCRQKGIKFDNHPQSGSTRSKSVEVTVVDHKCLIGEGVGILEIVNNSIDPKKPTFELIGDPNDPVMKSHWFKAKCLICPREVSQLCPLKRNLEANLMNHVHGVVHNKTLEDLQQCKHGATLSTGKRGRPSKTLASSNQFGQTRLHTFFKHTKGEIFTYEMMFVCARTCWGLRGPHCIYGGKSYGIDALLFDPHPGKLWYLEPHLEACFSLEGDVTIVKGVFRHRSCRRVPESAKPFPNLICDMCKSIVFEHDFRSHILREEHVVEKRGSKGSGLGRRACYLSVFELSAHSRFLTKKFKTEQMRHWSTKARITQPKVNRPTLTESNGHLMNTTFTNFVMT